MSRGGRSLLWQLGVPLMALQLVVAAFLGTYGLSRVRQLHLEQTFDRLAGLTPLVAERIAVLLDDDARETLIEEAADLAAETGVRITIVAPDGTVLADTERHAPSMEPHDTRPEIAEALGTGHGRAVRFSTTLGTPLVYVARRVEAGDAPAAVVRTAVPVTTMNATVRSTIRAVGLVGLISLLVTMAVIYLVSRRLSGTMSRMVAGAERFAAGDLGHRVRRPRSRELTALADALNEMAAQLEERLNELEAQRGEQRAILRSMSNGMIALDLEHRVLSVNRSAEKVLGLEARSARGRLLEEIVREPELNRFVTEAIAAGAPSRDELTLIGSGSMVEVVSQPLLDARERPAGLLVVINDVTHVRRLESIRSDFAANVSHELRTPITNILGYVETILDIDDQDAAQTRDFLRIIGRNAARLEAIVEDLLALARLEQDGVRDSIERRSVLVDDLVDAVVRTFAQASSKKRIAVRTAVEPDLEAYGAHQLLEQAVGNLVSNAVSYAPEGTTITISAAARDGSELEIAVTDEGPGIPTGHLPRLFERFYRVDRARSRELGGTGLGLAIVKHIALVHGGRAEVESTVGRGSLFRIILPRVPTASPQPV